MAYADVQGRREKPKKEPDQNQVNNQSQTNIARILDLISQEDQNPREQAEKSLNEYMKNNQNLSSSSDTFLYDYAKSLDYQSMIDEAKQNRVGNEQQQVVPEIVPEPEPEPQQEQPNFYQPKTRSGYQPNNNLSKWGYVASLPEQQQTEQPETQSYVTKQLGSDRLAKDQNGTGIANIAPMETAELDDWEKQYRQNQPEEAEQENTRANQFPQIFREDITPYFPEEYRNGMSGSMTRRGTNTPRGDYYFPDAYQNGMLGRMNTRSFEDMANGVQPTAERSTSIAEQFPQLTREDIETYVEKPLSIGDLREEYYSEKGKPLADLANNYTTDNSQAQLGSMAEYYALETPEERRQWLADRRTREQPTELANIVERLDAGETVNPGEIMDYFRKNGNMNPDNFNTEGANDILASSFMNGVGFGSDEYQDLFLSPDGMTITQNENQRVQDPTKKYDSETNPVVSSGIGDWNTVAGSDNLRYTPQETEVADISPDEYRAQVLQFLNNNPDAAQILDAIQKAIDSGSIAGKEWQTMFEQMGAKDATEWFMNTYMKDIAPGSGSGSGYGYGKNYRSYGGGGGYGGYRYNGSSYSGYSGYGNSSFEPYQPERTYNILKNWEF